MKTAQQALEELILATRPPRGCAVALTEATPADPQDVNWIAGMGVADIATTERYTQKVAELRSKHLVLDWSGIAADATGRKRVARWHSEVASAPAPAVS